MNFHENAKKISLKYHQTEAEILEIFQDLHLKKLYREKGCSSIFDYAVREMNLSESVTMNFTNVAKVALNIPALKNAIYEGKFGVSKARKICPVITPENHQEWIDKAATLTQRELEKEVASIYPETLINETVKYISHDRIKLQISISERTLENLNKVRDIESKKLNRQISFEETLESLLDFYLTKCDPVQKSTRALNKKRKPIPAQIKHDVITRDNNQCTFTKNGTRCNNRRWIHFHHIKSVAEGGQNTPENLTLLCSEHHKILHEFDPGALNQHEQGKTFANDEDLNINL